MRKFVLAGVAMVMSVGLALAADVVFVSYDKEKKELKVKDKEGKETTYKVTDKVTFKTGDKDTPAEKGVARLEKMDMNEKQKGKAKMKITTDGSDLKEVQFPEGKKKDK